MGRIKITIRVYGHEFSYEGYIEDWEKLGLDSLVEVMAKKVEEKVSEG